MADDFANVDSADLQTSKYQLLSQEAVNQLKNGSVKGVKILDYGQGDCNAIVDQNGAPLLFFDMGGGKHTGSRSHPWHTVWNTYPCASKWPDLQHKPTVILSHWDGDHYSTAWYLTHHGNLTTKTVPNGAGQVKDLRWLAPRQCKHPSKLEFVLDLTDLRCWPAATTTHTFKLTGGTNLVVDKCTDDPNNPYDPNLDGLAVVLEREDSGQVERMVLPGDAPYHVIPSCRVPILNGAPLKDVILLLAFHHGSQTHLGEATKHIPLPKSTTKVEKIAYTFGLKLDGGRCYGHPSKEAIEAYKAKGWEEAMKLLPSGGNDAFANWPPKPDDTGAAPPSRGDVSHDFTLADKPVAMASAKTGTKAIALRRKKTS